MKNCKSCNHLKSLDEFYKHPSGSEGVTAKCKACLIAYQKQFKRSYKKVLVRKNTNCRIKDGKAFCSSCKVTKSVSLFYRNMTTAHKLDYNCKECISSLRKTKYRGRVINYYRIRNKERKRTDVQFKLLTLCRGRLLSALKSKGLKKKLRIYEYLGCSIAELKVYLESKFKDGMSWRNHGKGPASWQIDHIKPLHSFDLSNQDQIMQACHYSNLQPLWHAEHLDKTISDRTSSACNKVEKSYATM